ncbi:hypothetical protein [Nocardioides pocheonensis]|uniref:DUF2867 domain-containing protein n=1 Tax=Nocardioides pocheonensis TaxID=661485 RepID=A0A3N0GK95_9ACTN|nr:hypothetical protein [Nocardioides pocheonensis]RNM12548.1 hypothetical protein EFL26_18135 [Nocardioides pocheonensis]
MDRPSPRDTSTGALSFVDEHRVLVHADADAVWQALGRSLPHGAIARTGARLLGAEPARAHGDPLVADSAVPGFGVHAALPGRELVLAGRHRFSVYRLTFSLEPRERDVVLVARTEARFPGLRGRGYRALVIGSGAHRRLTRRWLQGVRVDAQREGQRDGRREPA